MSNLLREYVKSILLEKASPKVSKQPESLNDLCRMLSATGINANSKRGAVNWAGSLEALDDAVKDNGLQLVTNKNGIKTTSAGMYTGSKNAILAFIRLSIDIENEPVKEVPVIIKPDNALIDPVACANKLKGGTALGYGVEHAIYSALKGTMPKSMIKAMKEQDARLTKLLAAAKNIAPDALMDYLDNVTTMRAVLLEPQNKEKIGNVVITGRAPGGGSSEYDIQAVGEEDPNHKYVFHAKYMSNRLVGIPQASSEDTVDPEEIEGKFKGKPLPLQVSSNSSIAFKIARDRLLFKFTPKKSLDGNVLNNADKQLTLAGEKVRKEQTKRSGANVGVAEINVIMRDEDLRNELFQMMKEAGFDGSINGDIKRQLGIDLKPQVDEEDVTEMTSVFINFLSVDNPDIFTFNSNQGANWQFELVPGETARLAFFVTARNGRKKAIENVMEIELGSIKRAKYVQIHKGTGFHAWLDKLSKLSK